MDAVLLDVDGTLVDTNLLHVLAWSRALRRLGVERDAATILGAIGMGGDRLVPALLGDTTAEEAEDARRKHAEEYIEKGLIRHAELLTGAPDLLVSLRGHDVRTALASSARREELDAYLDLLGGEGAVDALVTKDDVARTKPSPHLFCAALDALGQPDRALVMGDTVYDVAAAREIGLACICVLTGGIPRDTLFDAGAAAIYDGPWEVARDLGAALSLLRPPVR